MCGVLPQAVDLFKEAGDTKMSACGAECVMFALVLFSCTSRRETRAVS